MYRHEVKVFSKTLHVLLHIAALVCASIGIAAIVINKQDGGDAGLYSFHSWLGVLVFGAYVIQVNFLLIFLLRHPGHNFGKLSFYISKIYIFFKL
jgi:hypothetical protein